MRRPLVLQTHGMMDSPRSAVAALLDRVATRAVVRHASVVLTLSADEEAEVRRLSDGATPAVMLPNGVDLQRVPGRGTRSREIVFVARLHPRKGAVLFAEAAVLVAAQHPDVVFRIVGPDEGDGPAVRAILGELLERGAARIDGGLPHDEALAVLGGALCSVLPAQHEPFGMTVVESAARGTPVVIHRTSALAETVEQAGAGLVFDGGAEALAAAMERMLAAGEEGRRAMGAAGSRLVAADYSLEAVVQRVAEHYRSAMRAEPEPVHAAVPPRSAADRPG